MLKFFLLVIGVWCLLFYFRVASIGGIDPTFRQEEGELLLPLRSHLAAVVDHTLPYPQSSLLSGIVFGNQERIPFRLKNDLKITSTIHIVVVSGQNLTILAGFIMSLAAFLGRKKTIILTLGVILFYCVLTGLGVPVIRAAVMVLLTYLAQLFGKQRSGIWVLLLTAGLMLLYNPNWLLNISFQLSFLATFGVVAISPLVVASLSRIPQVLRQDLGVTLAAQLMVLPVIAYNFGQISLIGIVVNCLVLWVVPLVMVAGFFSTALGLFWTFLGQLAGLVPGILLTYFIYMVEFFAKLPGASLDIGETPTLMWVGYYLMLGAGIWWLKILKSKNKIFK